MVLSLVADRDEVHVEFVGPLSSSDGVTLRLTVGFYAPERCWIFVL